MNINVGIGDIAVSQNPDDIILTHSLGSCVAVLFYSPESKIGGMIHVALPMKPLGTREYYYKPGYYADEGLQNIIDILKRTNKFDFRKSNIYLVGGASPTKVKDVFMIGSRNLNAVRHFLNQRALLWKELGVGGYVSRTVELKLIDGSVTIRDHPLII